MFTMSRRGLLASAALGAAFGLNKKLAFISPAHAETPLEPVNGVYKYKVGAIEVTAVYDGIWRKPHDPTFIKNASIEETKAALANAGLTTEFMPIPLTVIVLPCVKAVEDAVSVVEVETNLTLAQFITS